MASQPNDARAVATALLGAVLQRRRRLDAALAQSDDLAQLAPRDRAHVRLLAATTLRRLGQVDAIIDRCLERPLRRRDMGLRDILRLGAVQILFLETAAYAAVDNAVGLARQSGHLPHAGLVNAVLRRIAREGPSLIAEQDAARLNTPAWLWDRWCAAYGEERTRAIATAHRREPPLDLTLNPTVANDTAAWTRRLDGAALAAGTVRRVGGGQIPDLPGFADGAWWVQDMAAALPALLLGDVAGKTVLDLCAAPGGKTAQLAAAGARVTAIDRGPARLAVLADNLARLKLPATLVTADATLYRPAAPVDAVLLDAPCSATGTVRRHPDIPHLKTAADVAKMAVLQDRLLAAAVAMLSPGGTLVYAVCSLEPEEGPARIDALLAAGLAGGAAVARVPVDAAEIGGLTECLTAAGDLRTLPCHRDAQGGMDGFYACRLRRL